MISPNLLAQAVDFNALFRDLQGKYQFDPKIGIPPRSINVPNPNPRPGAQEPLAAIVSAALPYTYLIAGLILFFLLIWSGFELLTAGDSQEKIKGASARITHALTGFMIVFLSYWLIRLVELILGVKIF